MDHPLRRCSLRGDPPNQVEDERCVMSSAEQDAVAKATRADGSFDEEVYRAEYKKGLRERQDRAVHQSHDTWRAVDGWAQVEGPEQWDDIVRQMVRDLESGHFFINRMGGQRYLD